MTNTASINNLLPFDIGDFEKVIKQLKNAGWFDDSKDAPEDYSSCLMVLIKSLNESENLEFICSALPYQKTNIELVDLLNVMAHLGYSGQKINTTLEDIDHRLLPCLLITDDKAYVVISHENDAFLMYDREADSFITVDKYTLKNEEIYHFDKHDERKQRVDLFSKHETHKDWFQNLAGRFKGVFWQAFVASIVLNLVALATPLFVMMVYDRIIGTHNIETINFLVAGVGLAIGTEWILRRLRTNSLAWFSARMDNIVSCGIFERLLLLPPVFTERASVSSQVARLKAFESVREFFSGPLFLVLIELPFTLILLAAVALIGGSIALVPIIMAILYILIILVAYPKIKKLIAKSAISSSARQKLNIETFEKMEALRTNGMTDVWFNEFRTVSGRASLANFKSSHATAIIETIAYGISVLAGVSTLAYGVGKVWDGDMTSGGLIASMILVWRILAPLQTLCTTLPRYEQVRNSIIQVNRLMELTPERSERKVTTKINDLKGKVEFNKVGLRYTKDTDPVFTGLSFSVEPGELIAVTGSNGSGKSTILKLVNGLYSPQAGSIRVDGIDIRQLDPIEFRKQIAYVPQNPEFFHGTIVENLRFADPLATEDVINMALMQVGVLDDINKLPNGIHTVIAESQSKQLPTSISYKLNLARAYIKNTRLMLFDELPYALLNSTNGEHFLETLQKWKNSRTMFMVTHRADYMDLADKVILLRHGERPFVGTPQATRKLLLEGV